MDLVSASHEMSETQLRLKITNLCVEFGLTVRYIEDERLSKSTGWPDLTILGTGMLWRELKDQRKSPTPQQWAMGNRLLKAKQSWGVWRPMDLLNGTVLAELIVIALVDTTVYTAADIAKLIS